MNNSAGGLTQWSVALPSSFVDKRWFFVCERPWPSQRILQRDIPGWQITIYPALSALLF